MRAILREPGIKLGTPARAAFAERVREVVGDDPLILPLVTPLRAILPTMLEQLDRLTRHDLTDWLRAGLIERIGWDLSAGVEYWFFRISRGAERQVRAGPGRLATG